MHDHAKYFDGQAPDSVSNPDIVNVAPYAIRSAIWFWLWREAFIIADKKHGIKDVPKITLVVNGGYHGLKDRENAYETAEAAFR